MPTGSDVGCSRPTGRSARGGWRGATIRPTSYKWSVMIAAERRARRPRVPFVLGFLLAGCGVTGYEPATAPPTASDWVLVAPPNHYRDGAIRLDDHAPLWEWRRLATLREEP